MKRLFRSSVKLYIGLPSRKLIFRAGAIRRNFSAIHRNFKAIWVHRYHDVHTTVAKHPGDLITLTILPGHVIYVVNQKLSTHDLWTDDVITNITLFSYNVVSPVYQDGTTKLSMLITPYEMYSMT